MSYFLTDIKVLKYIPNHDFELIAKLLQLARESIINETLAPLVVVTW